MKQRKSDGVTKATIFPPAFPGDAARNARDRFFRPLPARAVSSSVLLLLVLLCVFAEFAPAASFFAYTDSRQVFTLETHKENRAVLNVLNLTSFIQFIEPQGILIVGKNGPTAIGQVFAEKGADGQISYSASRVLKPQTATGVDLWGVFRGANDVQKVFITQGGRVFELHSLDEAAFESFMAKLSELDLKAPDVAAAMKELAIPDMGYFYSFEEAEELRKTFESAMTDEGINPPKVIGRVLPILTPEAEAAGYKGRVMVKVVIDRMGNVNAVKYDTPPPYGMGRRIEETIRNGWRFLPATSGGDVIISEALITLDFGRRDGP